MADNELPISVLVEKIHSHPLNFCTNLSTCHVCGKKDQKDGFSCHQTHDAPYSCNFQWCLECYHRNNTNIVYPLFQDNVPAYNKFVSTTLDSQYYNEMVARFMEMAALKEKRDWMLICNNDALKMVICAPHKQPDDLVLVEQLLGCAEGDQKTLKIIQRNLASVNTSLHRLFKGEVNMVLNGLSVY